MGQALEDRCRLEEQELSEKLDPPDASQEVLSAHEEAFDAQGSRKVPTDVVASSLGLKARWIENAAEEVVQTIHVTAEECLEDCGCWWWTARRERSIRR